MLNTLPSCEKTMSETGFGCQCSSIVMGFSNWSRPCLEKVHRKGKHGDTRLHVLVTKHINYFFFGYFPLLVLRDWVTMFEVLWSGPCAGLVSKASHQHKLFLDFFITSQQSL